MIFCVEDDESIRNLVVYTLNASGFGAEGFGCAEEFFGALEARRPRLILLDIMLPGTDGLEILKRLKGHAATADIPVIMATAKGSEFDKVTGLDLGADDYLAKPFGMMEMVSRIKAVLRRSAPARAQNLTFRELELDPERYAVTVAGVEVQLTYKEFALLKLFMENPGKAYTRDQLLDIIWDMDYMGQSRTVDVHVATLRTKLGQAGGYVQTVRGVGYRLAE